MRLKYYNLVIIVPVFFILGVILSSFNYYILTKEIKNGLYEEANSISKATGIFIKQDFISKDKDKAKLAFERIIRFERVNRIYLIKDDKVVISVADNKIQDMKIDHKKVKLKKIIKEKGLASYNYSYEIKDSPYSLFISVDATKENDSIEYVLYQAIVIVFIMLILGVIVSNILSFITRKNINSLNEIAEAISNGDYKKHNQSFMINEINDLSNTLQIVKSILKEMLYKTKNSILDTDFDKGDDLVIPTITIDEPKEVKSDSFDLAIAVNKNINKRELYSCWSDDKYIYGFVGELNSTSDYLKDYITILSAIKYIKHMMGENSFDLNKLTHMYYIKSFVSIKIDISEAKVYLERVFESRISTEGLDFEKQELKSFSHNLLMDTKLQNYIQMYSHLDLEKIAGDINRVFDRESAVIFVKKITTKI